MKIIGLTGGIGSGKSTIAKMFEALGAPVYYADIEAKKLMNNSKVIKTNLIKAFGNDSFVDDELNRFFIADIVFNDKEKLQLLNDIVHPEVEKHFKKWIKHQNYDYLMQENAIIFESNNQGNFDEIITVTAPKLIRIKRVMLRDKVSKEKVIERMQNQLNDKYKIEHSKYIINNIDLSKSENKVFQIHQTLLK